jgi:cytochrome c6
MGTTSRRTKEKLMRTWGRYGIAVASFAAVSAAVAAATLAQQSGAPTITRFAPVQGLVGSQITIYGQNLAGAQVQFNGVTAKKVTVNAAGTQIVAIVGPETMDGPGPVGVITAGGTVESKTNFTVSPPTGAKSQTGAAKNLKPAILSITPLKAKVGAKVTIKGSNLGGAMSVSFGGIKALYTVPSATKIVAVVPKLGKSGAIKVVTGVGAVTSLLHFVLVTSTPTTTTTGPLGGGTTTTGTGAGTTTTTASAALIGDPVAGAAVWTSAGCGSCHVMKAAGSTGQVGPSLDDVKPDQPTVVQQVTNGGEIMPAFSPQYSATQINNVAAYVYKSTH